jgi:hypothetical protein
MTSRIVLVLGIASLCAQPAHAERRTSVTVEPIFLVIGMIDATIEYQPTAHVGIAAIAGYGRPMLASSMYNLGGEGNVYLVKHFSGVHLGTEIEYMGGGTSIPFTAIHSSATERILGVYAGYKWVEKYGITAVAQLGVGHLDMHSTSDPPMSKTIPIATLTAGYSF